MYTSKAERHKAEKDFSNLSESPMIGGCADRSIPWPENPDGFVVPQKELEDFISSQTLYHAQIVTKRLIAIAEAARQIAAQEQVEQNFRLIRFIANEEKSVDGQQVMKAMLRAIDRGKEGINAARVTAVHVMDYGFESMTSYGNEFIYEEVLKRMRQTNE